MPEDELPDASQKGLVADPTAPVYAAGEIHVVAPAQVVWDAVAGVEEWPRWNPGISEVSIDGPLAEGTAFSWRAGRSKIRSVFRLVDPPRAVGWTGKTFGVKAVHTWKISVEAGGVRLRTEESWSGPLARLLKKKLNAMLAEAVDKSLEITKAEAERRATR